MKDIVERLLEIQFWQCQQLLCREAAAEIERLREALAETLQGYLRTEYYEQVIVDRARAALEQQK